MNILNTKEELSAIVNKIHNEKKKIVFTNGCFDILHAGHVDYLIKAKSLGDVLIVGLNSDSSMKRIKGDKRPLVPQKERALILSNLKPVDYVVIFEEDTPYELIKVIKIAGKYIFEENGGRVETINFVNFQSTTNIIKTVLDRFRE